MNQFYTPSTKLKCNISTMLLKVFNNEISNKLSDFIIEEIETDISEFNSMNTESKSEPIITKKVDHCLPVKKNHIENTPCNDLYQDLENYFHDEYLLNQANNQVEVEHKGHLTLPNHDKIPKKKGWSHQENRILFDVCDKLLTGNNWKQIKMEMKNRIPGFDRKHSQIKNHYNYMKKKWNIE